MSQSLIMSPTQKMRMMSAPTVDRMTIRSVQKATDPRAGVAGAPSAHVRAEPRKKNRIEQTRMRVQRATGVF